MWELSPSTREWEWAGGSMDSSGAGVYGTLNVASAANLPGARGGSVGWADASGDLWLFGGQGLDAAGNSGYLNDLWKYHPASGQWAWMGGSKCSTCLSGHQQLRPVG
jgi:N-acetylneuraminic acid mutarotase